MKNSIIAVLLVAAVALGAFSVHQRSQITKIQAQLESAESQLRAAEKQLKEMSEAAEKAAFAEKKATILQDTLAESSAAAAKQFQQVTQLEQSLAAAKTNPTSQGLGSLLKDPQMKEMIKAQQKAVMGPMIEKQYAALFQQLNLTPEQAATVKGLLEKKMLVAADMGMSMLDGDMDASKRAELGKQIKSETDAYDEQIKQLLGDDNYGTFKTYEKSMSDRFAVSQFRDQLAGTATALNAAQEQQLIQAMQEERSAFKWTTDFSQANSGEADFAQMFNEDRLNQFAQEKEKFDQQFLARAKQILTPEQLAAFEKNQTAQREMQISAMKMAAKMLAPKSP